MTSVRRLADEIESLVDAREAVLCDKLAAAIAYNDVLRIRVKSARADIHRLKNENEENDEIGRELAAAKTEVATLKTTVRGCEEMIAAARMRADWQWQKNQDSRAQLQTYATAAAAHAATAAAAAHAATAAARDRELADVKAQLADVKAQLATTQLRLRDKLELDALAQRGDLEAAAEQFRRSTRDPAADLRELGLAARENDDEGVEYL